MPKIVDKDLRRKEIIDAAAQAFAARGYSHTRMVDIAAEAGVSKGLVYEYFNSKADIFLEVCQNIVPWQSLPTSDYTPSMKLLEKIIRDIDASYEEAKDFFIIMSDFWTAAMRGPIDQRKVMLAQGASFYREPRSQLVEFIKTGQRTGVFKRAADPAPIANMILAAIEGIRMQAVLDPDNAQKDATLDRLIDTVKQQLAVEKKKSSGSGTR